MNNIAFNYKNGNSLIHRTPAVIKILLIPAVNILFFLLPYYFSVGLFFVQLATCFYLRFTIKEQLNDLKPVIYYAVLLYFTTFIGQFFTSSFNLKLSVINTFSNFESLKMLLKLFCIMQCASIIFKTSTTLQIREGIGQIETFIRKLLPVSKKNKFTNAISLFMCFIPLVYRNWEQCKRAWFARRGKKTIFMFLTILPVFFSVGIKQAWNTSRALYVRENQD